MNARALKTLLRECAVLLTALAFIMSGALAPRQHAEAAAFGALTGDGFVICHPDAADASDPAKLPASHRCDQCAICHFNGVAVISSDGVASRDWQALALMAGSAGLSGAARAALPFATGPPAA